MIRPSFLPYVDARLDRRWFLVFFLFQIAFLATYLWLPKSIFYGALMAGGGVLILILLFVYPWIIVPAIVASTSLDIAGQLVETTALGLPLTGFHISLCLMFVALTVNIFLRRRFDFPRFELAWPLLLFLSMMAVSLIYSPNQPEATIGFVRIGVLIVFLYGVQVLIDGKPAITLVVVSMALAVICSSILAVAQIFSEKFYLPASFMIAVGANAPRSTGTFHNPNTFGTFLMVGIVLLTGLLMNFRMPRWQQLGILIAIALGITGLVTTFSRTNWLATLIGVLVVLYMARKLSYVVAIGAVGLGIIVAIKEFVPFAEHIFERFLSIFTIFDQFTSVGRASSSARVYFVIAGFEMFLDSPFLGQGWRAFPVIFDAYRSPDFPHWVPTKESHTLLANVIAELGIVGLVASVWIVFRTMRRGVGAIRNALDPYCRAMLMSLVAVFVAFQVSLSFTADFENNFLWFFTGMLFAVAQLSDKLETK